GFARCRVVADNPLDIGFLHQLGPRSGNLVHQQIGPGAVFDNIRIVARVAGDHGDAPTEFDAIAVGRLDYVTMVDLEGDDLDAVLLVNDAVALVFGHGNPNTFE